MAAFQGAKTDVPLTSARDRKERLDIPFVPRGFRLRVIRCQTFSLLRSDFLTPFCNRFRVTAAQLFRHCRKKSILGLDLDLGRIVYQISSTGLENWFVLIPFKIIKPSELVLPDPMVSS
jgi:hypothetical protein